ncbi:MAG: radical SAM protein [Nitrospirota bacterium]
MKLPKCLYLETTNRCNLRCKGCIHYRGSWEPERDMSLKNVIMIADQFPGLERAVLHGIGEPLLNRELPGIIRHLKNRKVTVLFNSNGVLLNEKKQTELIDSCLDELRISLDAASSNTYKAIRSSDKFDLIISNLSTFNKRLISQQLSRPKVSLWFLGSKENIDELPDLIQLAASIGVPEVHLQRLVYFLDENGYGLARPEKTLTGSDERVLELIQKSKDLAQQLGIVFSASGLSDPINSLQQESINLSPWKKCYRPSEVIYITSNGNVLPCCISPFSTADYEFLILGNVFETSVAEIWFGPKYRAFRKQHCTNSPPKCCRGCGVLWSL